MKEFEVLKLIFISIPTGMFVTYGILWAITLTLKVKKTEEGFRKLMTLYCLLAGVTGLLLVVYYFFPDVFFRLNILYGGLAAYTMVSFYHFLYHAAKLAKRFNPLHYIAPALLGLGLLIFSIIKPEIWALKGNKISLSVSLGFGIIYSALPLYEMHKFQIAQVARLGSTTAIDNSKAIPFVCEIVLYPIASIVLPLIGGSNPSVGVSILLILCCFMALYFNIPLTYGLIRHYIGSSHSDVSLFESAMHPSLAPVTVKSILDKQVQEREKPEGATVKRVYHKQTLKPRDTAQPTEINKKEFESYFRKHKPFLNSKFAILDLVEPLNSNRTYISKFINTVYGMSFSSYVNLCRLRELDRLKALASNKGKSESELCLKAGFGKYRNFLYVKKQFATVINPQTEKDND